MDADGDGPIEPLQARVGIARRGIRRVIILTLPPGEQRHATNVLLLILLSIVFSTKVVKVCGF
jgi:hypothetical protein